MRGLRQLLAEPASRDELRRRGIFDDAADFRAALRPRPSLLGKLWGPKLDSQPETAFPIWAGQQLYVDAGRSVFAKLRALEALRGDPKVEPVFICADTDRAGSEKAMTSLRWQLRSGFGSLSLAPVKASKHCEPRFVESPKSLREDAARKLQEYLRQLLSEEASCEASTRLEAIRARLLNDRPASLAEINHSLTFEVARGLGYSTPMPRLSELLDCDALVEQVNRWLNNREACIAAFNSAIAELETLDIDPCVRPLPADHLPLYASCPEDGSRVKLRFERRGGEAFALGQTRSGRELAFPLGAGVLDMAALRETQRWSPDVCLPVLLDALVSGAVVGKSSALYGLVMNRVLERALGDAPAPMLVACAVENPDDRDSALFAYLTGNSSWRPNL